MDPRGKHADLYLNNRRAGSVLIKGDHEPWHFGDFSPSPYFAPFALTFGEWSLLIHAVNDDQRIDPAALDELRAVEQDIDSLHAKLFFPESRTWQGITQLNIDGPLIEWKES